MECGTFFIQKQHTSQVWRRGRFSYRKTFGKLVERSAENTSVNVSAKGNAALQKRLLKGPT
jgi:hypothetical protein